jgi:glycerate dehydrogenase
LVLELAMHVGLHSRSVQDGDWAASADFSYWRRPLVELHGRTFGIVGLGKIGQAVARIALAMGMRVIASHKHPERDAMSGVTFVDLPTVFQESDVVSLHCPLTDSNKGFVNRELLGRMKKSAFFINVSRGGLVNETDLADALNSGRIAGAGLDVLSEEPATADNPLVQARNCLITPHIAWATQAARRRLMGVVVENLKAFLEGRELNRVV